MFENFGFAVSNLFKEAEKERYNLSHPYVGSEHLMLAILKGNSKLRDLLANHNLTYKRFKAELIRLVGIPKKNIDINLYTPLLKRIMSSALSDAKENNKGIVTETHLLIAMLDEGEGIAIRIMIGLGIDIDSLYDELKIKPHDVISSSSEIFQVGTVLNDKVDTFDKVIGREKEINALVEILLRKKKSNPLLIGPAGVGKTAIIEELARRIKEKNITPALQNKKIIELPMGDLVSGTKYRGEFEERLTKIIKEIIKNKNIILFIDEVHTMINAGGAEGAINASDILKPYLARGDIKVIGATTTEEYEKFMAKDKALERRFELIQVSEPDIEETRSILKGLKNSYELHHNVIISDENIDDMLSLSQKYLFKKKNPDKTIDLLDSVCAHVKRKSIMYDHLKEWEEELEALRKEKEECVKKNQYDQALTFCVKMNELEEKIKNKENNSSEVITKTDILDVIEQKSNIPLFLNKDNMLSDIEKVLKKGVLYQNAATNKILESFKCYFAKNSNLKLLMIGPSGVGKTSSVKLIANALKTKLIKLDMSEYNLDTSVNKLIGVSHGYVGYNDEYIFNQIKYNPYSIILVDEIEKAHPSVLNLFLQIMDDGVIHDAHGEPIDFSHTMIFMTSNAYQNKCVGFNEEKNSQLNETFSEEFLGRFDNIITFEKISKNQVEEYLKEKITNKNIDLNEIIKETKYQKYGFRYLNKVIEKYNLKQSIN